MNFNNMLMLTGSNHRAWRDSVMNYICMHKNIGFCFTMDQPDVPSVDDKNSVKAHYNKWMRSNMMAKNTIRTSMSSTIRVVWRNKSWLLST